MPLTLDRAKLHLEAWLDAELAVTQGQSYSIGSRSLTRANLSEIRKQVDYWSAKVKLLESKNKGIRRTTRVIPRDF